VVAEIDAVRRDPGLFRVAGFGDALVPNTAMAYGLQDIRGYDGMWPDRYTRLVHRVFPMTRPWPSIPAGQGHALLDLLNVKYVFGPPGLDLPGDRFAAVHAGRSGLYRNLTVFPRAFLAGGTMVLSDADALETVALGRVDLRTTVVLTREIAPTDRPAPGTESDTAPGIARPASHPSRAPGAPDAPGAIADADGSTPPVALTPPPGRSDPASHPSRAPDAPDAPGAIADADGSTPPVALTLPPGASDPAAGQSDGMVDRCVSSKPGNPGESIGVVSRAEDLEGPGEAKVTSYEATRVEVAVRTDRRAWLVLSDRFAPGWRATVDGDDATLYEADYALRAVIVPAGAHQVVFRYAPWSLRLGLALSAASLPVLALGLALVGRYRRRTGRRLRL
jgi:hypothetical protein